jgi:chromosomal replication initiation ATPase DnaA
MRIDLADTEAEQRLRTKNATDALLIKLKQQHDYSVRRPFVRPVMTKREVVEIKVAPEIATPIEVCILPVPEGRLTIEAIKRVVCKHFKITHNDMISERRHKKVQQPRAVAMYLAKEFTPSSLPMIGRHFGNRDHTTALHSIQKIARMMLTDDPLVQEVSYLREVLSS